MGSTSSGTAIDVTGLTAHECRALLAAGQVSAVELTQAYLDRIVAVDGEVKAYLLVDEAGALSAARSVDAKPKGERLPWEGVPIGLKDVLCVKGMETTCASRILKGYVPPYDATAVARLRQAGLIFLGKINMDEFAMGSFHPRTPPIRSPQPLGPTTRVPGGSSGGSAAWLSPPGRRPSAWARHRRFHRRRLAVRSGRAQAALRRGHRYGLIAFASSLDQIGPSDRDVNDVPWCFRPWSPATTSRLHAKHRPEPDIGRRA